PALTMLKSLSDVVPKDVKVDVTLYQYNTLASGGGKMVLRGETDSYASVDQILDAVKKSPVLKGVETKQSGPKPGTDTKVIEFTTNADYAGTPGQSQPKA